MAPVDIDEKPSLLPFATVGSHLAVSAILTILVGRSILRSYLALPPSSATRHREPARKSHVKTFAGLAAASLIFATYWGFAASDLSYRVWAEQRGVELPESFFGDKGAFRGGEHPGRLQLVRWLNDTPVYQDTWEVIAEKARRYWWGQQIDLATVSWGMLLAAEGRRRKISQLWAFMLLGQAVSLSFAQNLFFVAMLLTPVPLPENVKELTNIGYRTTGNKITAFFSKPDNWCPNPIIYLMFSLLSFGSIFLVPYAAETPSFMAVTLTAKALSFAPLILPYILPESLGTVHVHPHDAHSAYMKLFRTISIFSILLHGKSTALALLYNTPDSHYHRHSIKLPFYKEHRSMMERTSTAITKVLGAVGDHPAVSAVGWDVLLSGLSIGIWATTRGLDAQEILASSGLWASKKSNSTSHLIAVAKSAASEVADEAVIKMEDTPTPTRRRRTKKIDPTESQEDPYATMPKRRGRSSRKSAAAEADSAYIPTEIVQEEGDEYEDEDWEAGALTWGLISLSGLGAGSAGVFGAETTAR